MRCRRLQALVFPVLLITAAVARAQATQPYSDLSFPAGTGVQRTLRLLEESDRAGGKTSPVRILFYGQSITQQDWWKQVVDDLRRKYPKANLDARNLAIGGFAVPLLSRPAEHDVFPFYPDLILFHVYGGEPDYTSLIREFRTRLTSEILLQSDHITQLPPSAGQHDHKWDWHHNHSTVFLPALARELHLGFVDVHSQWLSHLLQTGEQPGVYLADGVHLNARGNDLMARYVSAYLQRNPNLPEDRLVTDYPAPALHNGELEFTFTGNRLDLVGTPAELPANATFTLDGRPLSSFPGATYFTRGSGAPGPGWPAITRIDRPAGATTPPATGNYSITILTITPDHSHFTFSLTGPDGPLGQGDSDHDFTSSDGHVLLRKADWYLKPSFDFSHQPTTPGTTFTFSAKPQWWERWPADPPSDPNADSVTVIQGIPNTKHTLTIRFDAASRPAIKALRVFTPPLDPTVPIPPLPYSP